MSPEYLCQRNQTWYINHSWVKFVYNDSKNLSLCKGEIIFAERNLKKHDRFAQACVLLGTATQVSNVECGPLVS